MRLYRHNENKGWKPPIILSLFVVALISYSVSSHPLMGYETSVYDQVGEMMLFVLISALIYLYAVAVYNAANGKQKLRFFSSILGIQVLNLNVLILPYLRGYYRYGRGDSPTNLSEISNILESGAIPTNNIYPGTHLPVAFLDAVTSIPTRIWMSTLQIILFLISPLFLYILARKMFCTRIGPRVTAVLATVPLLSYRFATALFDEQAIGVLFIPLIIFAVVSTLEQRRFFTMMIPLVFLIILVHPVISILTLLSLFGIIIISAISSKTLEKGLESEKQKITALLFILIILLFLWLDRGAFLERYVFRFGLLISGTELSNPATDNVVRMTKSGMASIAISFVKRTFHDFLFVSISLAVLLFWALNFKRKKVRINPYLMFGLVWFLISGLFQLAQLLTQSFGAFSLFIFRFVGPTVILTPLFVSLGFVLFKDTRWVKPLILLLLITSSIVGVLSTHPDPYTGKTNYQVTESELEGTKWLSEYGSKNRTVVSVRSIPWRLADYVIGREARRESSNFVRGKSRVDPGFADITNGQSRDVYLFISEVDINTIKRTEWPWSQYRMETYNGLSSNRNRVYTTGSVTITT